MQALLQSQLGEATAKLKNPPLKLHKLRISQRAKAAQLPWKRAKKRRLEAGHLSVSYPSVLSPLGSLIAFPYILLDQRCMAFL
jgi:hypothetical protein